jgi:ATP-dependent Lon protease
MADVFQHGEMPERLSILPLRNLLLFPGVVTSVLVGRDGSKKLIEQASHKGGLIVLALQKDAEIEDPQSDDMHHIGVVAAIQRVQRLPDNQMQVLVRGIAKVALSEFVREDSFWSVRVQPLAEADTQGRQVEALGQNLSQLFQKMVSLSPNLTEELKITALNLDRKPAELGDFVAAGLDIAAEDKQRLLEETSLRHRLEQLTVLLNQEVEVLEMGHKIQDQVREEMGQTQREHYLRQQLRAIQEELGQGEEDELAQLRQRLGKAGLPETASKEAERELKRLEQMAPASAEYGVGRNYLDWILSLPWNSRSKERIELKRARAILDEDHEGLEQVKERILEYLAVRKLNRKLKSPIFCFAGPPGVGKTSLGRSIARALGRKLVRLSLGGVRDEAEIRGHRRTYVGALPGRIVQSLRQAGTNNPVMLLDEVDKLGADFRGDPAAALLEVLDPEQNTEFTDHFLDVPFDLSDVLFIATANQLESIPPALRDRLEIIHLSSYTEEEKVRIARSHLLPRQLEVHGLKRRKILVDDDALRAIVRGYTREAGLRNLEREIGRLCRKIALKVVEGHRGALRINAVSLSEYLGALKIPLPVETRIDSPGIVAGLAWTPVGGEIMHIEVTRMAGSGRLTLTGQLGEVMKESAQIALSYLRAQAGEWDLDANFFEASDIHIHFPAGAIPKDGPSAGVATATALLSLLSDKVVRPDMAMTGEVTLRGRVLAVGGIKEKVLAAHRAGMRSVMLPRQNEKDLDELPATVRAEMDFVLVDELSEAFAASLGQDRVRRAA